MRRLHALLAETLIDGTRRSGMGGPTNRWLSLGLAVILCGYAPFTAAAATGDDVLPSGLAFADIETVIDDYVAEHEATTAALSVAVFAGPDVVFEKAYGFTDLENSIRNSSSSVVEWGSTTKLLVWASAIQLVECGQLDLTADVRTYLPDGFLTRLRYETPVTMLNLMNHDAGWQEVATDLFIVDASDVKELPEALKLIEPEQVFEPGTVVAYSNWGAALAGYIVERVSGQAFDAYVHEHIFEPLGMDRTAIGPTLSDLESVSEQRERQRHYTTENQPLGTSRYHLSLYPAGMATGAFSDLMRFGQAFLPADGEPSPLFARRETLDEMLTPSLLFADRKTPRNVHGFWTDELGVSVLWHNGGTPGSTAWLTLDPESGVGLVTSTNQPDESIYNVGLLPVVFGRYQGEAGRASTVDISGLYNASRTIFSGFAKPYSLFTLMPVDPMAAGGYVIPGRATTLMPAGDGGFVLDRNGMKQTLVFADTTADGRSVLQFPGMDYLEVDGFGVMAQIALLALFAAAGLLSLVALVGRLIGFVRHRPVRGAAERFRILVHLAVVLAMASVGYMALTLFSTAPLLKDVRWMIVVNGALASIPVAYAVFLAVRWPALHSSRKEKGMLIAAGAAGLVMTSNILFWESYRFW